MGSTGYKLKLIIFSTAALLFSLAFFPFVTASSVEQYAHTQAYYQCPLHPSYKTQKAGECNICGMELDKVAIHKTPANSQTSPKVSNDTHNTQKSPDENTSSQTLYTCSMHPQVVQENPGQCPICHMDLVPMKQKQQSETEQDISISIDPVVVQNMGLRVAQVRKGSIHKQIRTIGEIDVAEDRIFVVNLRYSGWVEKVYANQTGKKVNKGAALFSIYSPELVSAQKEYLIAVNTSGKDSELARSAAERLNYLDIPANTLETIVQQQNVKRRHIIRAPRSGYILHKNVLEGARVNAGNDVYRIGNLTQIWVTADIYEFDAPWVKLGQKAHMELSYMQGKRFQGKVDYIYPTLDPKSRTLKVRLEFANPGIALKPGMFATIWIQTRHKVDAILIPTEAIIHSGQRQLVFVTKKHGHYAAREITTGLVGDNHVTEVLDGLKPGETIVTSGQFLLDSESQLQEALQKLLNKRLHTASTNDSQHTDHDQEQHSGSTKEDDNAANNTFWTCPMHPHIVQKSPGDCPICGMDLVKRKKRQ